MSVANLNEVLSVAMAENYAIAGLVVLGWEEANAYVQAAAESGIPIILQAGPSCRKHTPVPILGKMFNYLAENATVPVVCHIDHGYSYEECIEGIESGFSSVMFDGSNLPLDENIEITSKIIEKAHKHNISVEGEVGIVGYANGASSANTSAAEASRFEKETNIDALAVSIGNMHLQTEKTAIVDYQALNKIEEVTKKPLVLHGGSGLPINDRLKLAKTSRVCKFNIGTELRQKWGLSLRNSLDEQPGVFDRVTLLKPTIEPVKELTKKVIEPLRFPNID